MAKQALREVWAAFARDTAKASENSRTLALGGLAAVWLFAGGSSEGDVSVLATAATAVVLGGVLFALALGFDVVQYAASGLAYSLWARKRETLDNAKSGSKLDVPAWLPGVGGFFYYLKVLALLGGYASLVVHIASFL